MDVERAEKITNIVQSLAIGVAVVVGGLWTAYTFSSQLQVENARAQLAMMQRQLQAEPKLELELTISPLGSTGKPSKVFVGTVSARNVGTATTSLALNGLPVRIYRVTFDAQGAESWSLVRSLPLRMDDRLTMTAMIAWVGSTKTASFATALQEPGFYVGVFSAVLKPAEDRAIRSSEGLPLTGGRIEWGTERYFTVE